jgi:hypothetical protein
MKARRSKQGKSEKAREQQEKVKYYLIYNTFRAMASDAMKTLGVTPKMGLSVTGALAAALVDMLKGYTLRHIKEKARAEYLHQLFSTMLNDVIGSEKGLTGTVFVTENRPKKRRKKK